MSVENYNPKEVHLIVGGYPMSGFAEDTMVTIARNEQAFSLQMGVDGFGTRSKSNNRSGTISFSLMQTSDSNKIMSDIAKIDELSGGGIVPVMVEDGNGTSLYTAKTAWVQKLPDSEFSINATAREWVLETDELIANIGGN